MPKTRGQGAQVTYTWSNAPLELHRDGHLGWPASGDYYCRPSARPHIPKHAGRQARSPGLFNQRHCWPPASHDQAWPSWPFDTSLCLCSLDWRRGRRTGSSWRLPGYRAGTRWVLGPRVVPSLFVLPTRADAQQLHECQFNWLLPTIKHPQSGPDYLEASTLCLASKPCWLARTTAKLKLPRQHPLFRLEFSLDFAASQRARVVA